MGFQLTLGLALNTKKTFENFVLGENNIFFAALKAKIEKPQPFISCISGPSLCGKSHFLQALCHERVYMGVQSAYIELHCLKSMDILKGLEQVSFLCFDHYESLSESSQKILLDFIKSPISAHRQIVISTQSAEIIAHLEQNMPNLIAHQMIPLNCGALEKFLKIKIEERGLSLPEDVQELILKKSQGDMTYIAEQIKKIERHCDTERKKLSLRYARNILEQETLISLDSSI